MCKANHPNTLYFWSTQHNRWHLSRFRFGQWHQGTFRSAGLTGSIQVPIELCSIINHQTIILQVPHGSCRPGSTGRSRTSSNHQTSDHACNSQQYLAVADYWSHGLAAGEIYATKDLLGFSQYNLTWIVKTKLSCGPTYDPAYDSLTTPERSVWWRRCGHCCL